MDTVTASLTEQREPGRVKRRLRFDKSELCWDIAGPDEILPRHLARHDLAATALVHFAMSKGRPLHVDGPVSGSLLRNLEDFVACWTVWRPDLYKRIEITASEETDDRPPEQARALAVVAFSGGVDASFTVLRHWKCDVGRRSRKIHAGVLIQGLDIPLDAHTGFAVAAGSATAALASLGIPLLTVRTNWKDVCADWEMEFGVAVSTALRNWQDTVATALLGSDEDYSRMVLPWGGNPLTYSMLSCDDFRVVYDGGECTRTEKVRYLSQWTSGMENLRVCWAGPMTGGNCGTCEKCVRTKLNFLAAGVELPSPLAVEPNLRQVLGISATNAAQLALLQEIVAVAERRGVNASWVQALRFAISKSSIRIRLKASPILKPWLPHLRAARGRVAGLRRRLSVQETGRS